jgi:small nuclear ribonucleoprotein (snRNP)-like protein
MNYRPYPKKHNFSPHGRPVEHFDDEPFSAQDLVHPENTGAEAEYLQNLVESHAKVTVKLVTGETLHGHIRYYDQDCFSIGLSASGPRIFLRKSSVAYIEE